MDDALIQRIAHIFQFKPNQQIDVCRVKIKEIEEYLNYLRDQKNLILAEDLSSSEAIAETGEQTIIDEQVLA